MKRLRIRTVRSMTVPDTIVPMCEWAKQEVERLRVEAAETADVSAVAASFDRGGVALSLVWPAGADQPEQGFEIVTGGVLGINENSPRLPSSMIWVVSWWAKGQRLLTRNLSQVPDQVTYKQYLRSIGQEVEVAMRRSAA